MAGQLNFVRRLGFINDDSLKRKPVYIQTAWFVVKMSSFLKKYNKYCRARHVILIVLWIINPFLDNGLILFYNFES